MPWRWPWYRSPGLPDKTAPRHPLREFVYLDEVSVYSLLASRSGPVPTDFTDTESESLQDEISGTLSLGVPGTKSEVRGRSETATSSSSQIVRKSSAQARFKQFLEAEQIDFVFSAAPEASAAYNPTAIQRGNLFEMQVELDADETFQISTTIASLFVDRAEVEQVLAFNRILERLLVGLVPIKAKAVDYVVVQHDGAPRIIQRSTLDSLPLAACAAEPLYVVGFTQQDLFWKDLRTVLFGHHRYVLTGRLAVSDIQTQWSPVKLAEVLRSFLPELADQLDEVGRGFGTAIRASVRSAEQSAHDSTLHDALIDFGMRITTIPATTDELHNLLADWHPPGDAEILDGTLEQTRRAFASVVDLFRDRVGDAGIDDTQIARHRSDVIVEYGLPPAPARSVAPAAPHLEPEINNGWYLETEVIALYW
jgi:hypothetical protein